jgi:hypothetical protein
MRLAFVSILFVGVSVFAYDFPLLQKTLGGIDKTDGVTLSRSCQIFDTHSKMDVDKIMKLIAQAEKEPIEKFVHNRKEVPSIEVWANYPEKFAAGPAATGLRPRKILLLRASSNGESRNGKASDELMKLVEANCHKM